MQDVYLLHALTKFEENRNINATCRVDTQRVMIGAHLMVPGLSAVVMSVVIANNFSYRNNS